MSLFDTLFAADFVEHEELPPGTPPGREGPKAMTMALRSAFPDFKVTIDELIAEGDKVFLLATWSGTQAGDFMGIPSSGKSFSVPVFDLMRVEDGKLAEHWGLTDNLSMMQQLGAAPGSGQS